MSQGELSNPAEVTPSITDLVAVAIKQGGTDVAEVTERLLAAKYRDEDRERLQAFNRAFAAFRKECPSISKDKVGGDVTEGGGRSTWRFASMGNIQSVVDPLLKKHGLTYRWSNDQSVGDTMTVTCTVVHDEGHSESTNLTIAKPKGNRLMTPEKRDGAALAYAQRLTLSMALGIATTEGDNPQGDDGETINDEELSELESLIETTGTDKSKLLRWLGVESLSALPASQFFRAQNALKAKQGQDD